MDLHHVRYFVAIAQSGSFTAAAEVAFVTQPTLSSAMAKLEAELGVHLFERGSRGVRLTDAGQRFLPRARSILKEIEIARADFKGGDKKVSRRLRVGLLISLPVKRIAPVLRALGRIEPTVRWTYVEGGLEELRSQLNAGKLDFLITNLLDGRGHYRQLPLFTDTLRLAVASRASLARARHVSLEALDGQPLIVRTHCEHLQHASRILDRDGVKPMVVHRTRYDDRALAFVAGGLGTCFIPDSFSLPGVTMLRVGRIDLRRTVGIEWPSDSLEPLVPAMLECFAAAQRRGNRGV